MAALGGVAAQRSVGHPERAVQAADAALRRHDRLRARLRQRRRRRRRGCPRGRDGRGTAGGDGGRLHRDGPAVWCGGQFVLVPPGLTHLNDRDFPEDGGEEGMTAADVAGRILETFEEPFLLDGTEVYTHASIGISVGAFAVGMDLRYAWMSVRS